MVIKMNAGGAEATQQFKEGAVAMSCAVLGMVCEAKFVGTKLRT